MIRFHKALLILFLLSLPVNAASQEQVPIDIITHQNWQYSFEDDNTGEIKGIAADLVRNIFERAEIPYAMSINSFRRAERAAIISPNTCMFIITRTSEREDNYQWVGPLYIGGWEIQSTDDSIKVNSIDDLKPHTLAVLRQHAASKNFLEENGVKTIAADNWESFMRLLRSGRATLALMGPQMADMHNLKGHTPYLHSVYSIRSTDLSLACHKDMDKNMIKRLNDINQEIGEDRQKLFTKY